jgi:hypothetical protein|tara:strand:+ start:12549 stop:13829 length:1281 start_codon:yes stop_codon:yes gene_type:complete
MIYSGEMYWFIGAVEDRVDPEELGRVKVRCFGIHTDDKNILPTYDLPWASMMLPANSAGTGTVGQSATGIVQGAWVVGFFTDGKNMQQPLIMGVLPSIPYEKEDKTKGFIDPDSVNPLNNEFNNDQPISATSNYVQHPSYFAREDLRQLDVETAVPPKMSTAAIDLPDSYYDRLVWSTPETHQGKVPGYPFNKVLSGESGHTIEVDDTPDNPRLAQYHTSGTNYEINGDGEKYETIVGDNYQIVLKGNNLYVKGNMNITVEGNLKQLVKGNYHLEVEGEVTENFKSSRSTKIKNSEFKETQLDFVSNVGEDYTQRIGGMEQRIVDSDMRTTITGKEERMVKGDFDRVIIGNTTTVTKENENKTVTGTLDILSLKDLTIETAANMTTDVDLNKTVKVGQNVDEDVSGNQTTTITGNLDVDANRIDLN